MLLILPGWPCLGAEGAAIYAAGLSQPSSPQSQVTSGIPIDSMMII